MPVPGIFSIYRIFVKAGNTCGAERPSVKFGKKCKNSNKPLLDGREILGSAWYALCMKTGSGGQDAQTQGFLILALLHGLSLLVVESKRKTLEKKNNEIPDPTRVVRHSCSIWFG